MKFSLERTRQEKDFEAFIKLIPALEPNSFCGLCKVLCVPMHIQAEEFREEEMQMLAADKKIKEMNSEELIEMKKKIDERAEYLGKMLTPRNIEDIMNDLMDHFLELNKRKRREILTMLKDYKRGL